MLSDQPWPPLAGQRDVAALPLALSTEFTSDRVTAHSGKREFYYLDSVACTTERYRRTVISFVQGLVMVPVVALIPVK
jgi:hypothetical protein